MAFNFNWSPLTADNDFYTRAQDLLTAALNKSPKPPIIVDDIIVNELNLGSVPPELEILEIGDLAEDRFRGIFKMCYSGDAFLTLKTRVQANPLNTYLSTKPSFVSPQPLAASAGLIIPLQITLSEIKLSAFIILVFSKQKGLTLVFRNDPLESLKVSSTFDAIPFVRDYLQKEIEGQLRVLLMEEVPLIIHRLSLRLWVPEYRAKEDEKLARDQERSPKDIVTVDPLASPPQDPLTRDEADIASLSLNPADNDSSPSQFSQKNLLRLATLTDSNRTLSLFTPSIQDAVFRAWAGPSERGEGAGSNTPITPLMPGLTRGHSFSSGTTGTSYSLSDRSDTLSMSTRPSLTRFHSAAAGLNLGAGHTKPAAGKRIRKTRVINLRQATNSGASPIIEDEARPVTPIASSVLNAQERYNHLETPPRTPHMTSKIHNTPGSIDLGGSPPKLGLLTPRPITPSPRPGSSRVTAGTQTSPDLLKLADARPSHATSIRFPSDQAQLLPHRGEKAWIDNLSSSDANSHQSSTAAMDAYRGGIVEQAWMMKFAGEIARRAEHPKMHHRGHYAREDSPPPAYEMRSR